MCKLLKEHFHSVIKIQKLAREIEFDVSFLVEE